MAKFEKHIFICGNQRPPGHPRGCCDPAGRAELQKLFKQKLAERGLKSTVRANQSGCLDQCEHGPNLVVYPDAIWYGGVTLADVDEIVDSHIVGGKPVERLRMKESCINTASCEHKRRNRKREPAWLKLPETFWLVPERAFGLAETAALQGIVSCASALLLFCQLS